MTSDHPPVARIGAGERLADRYVLLSRIGGGGMGEVWKAQDDVLGRIVAVKVLRPEFADDQVFRERLRREARAAGGISHRGVVPVFDYGDIDEPDVPGVSFIVMEFVDGPSLAEEITALGPLGADRTLLIIEQAASALQAAHDLGVVHRDVKPGNILVTVDGDVKIADFGIARSADALSLTRTGSLTGTAKYFSPEQAAGTGATAASDIYSLGVVAYACLTGNTPFSQGNDISIALAHIQQPVPELPGEVPHGLRSLIMSMLAKDPGDRPATAGAVAASARSQIQATGPRDAGRHPFPPTAVFDAPTRIQATPAMRSRRPLPLKAIAIVAVALIALLILLALFRTGSKTVPDVVGKQQNAAVSLLAVDGLNTKILMRDVPGKRAGMVTAQSSPGGAAVNDGSTVTLTVATGNVAIPKTKLIGPTYDRAAAILAGLGLRATMSTQVSSSTPGTVIAIVPDSKAAIGSSVSLIVAASAPAPASVPTDQGNAKHGKKNGKKDGGGNNQD